MRTRAICLLVVFVACNVLASPRKCGPTETSCTQETTVSNMVTQVNLAPVTAEEIELLPLQIHTGNL